MSFDPGGDKRLLKSEGHGGRCGEEPADGDEPQQAVVTEGDDSSRASRGITPSMSSLEEIILTAGGDPPSSRFSQTVPSSPDDWTGSLDWVEVRGRIDWSGKSGARFAMLLAAYEKAREDREDQELTLGEREVFMSPDGMGRGRAPRMTYKLLWGEVTIAFADRESDKRQNANFYCCVPGKACLIRGAINALEDVHKVIEFLGGTIVEEWFQRLDLCVDLPGVEFLRDFYPSISAGHFLTTAKTWGPHDGPNGPTGFSVYSANLLLRFYNKLFLVNKKPDEEVLQFMKAKRWGGEIPPCATRIELEIRRAAQHRYGLETVAETLQRIPDIVAKLLGIGPYPYFRLLDAAVDRVNKHQSRVADLPLWASVLECMSKISGQREQPLRTFPRAAVTGKNVAGRIINALIRLAISRGRLPSTRDDLIVELNDLCLFNLIEDCDVERKALLEARRKGLLDELTGFNPSEL